MQHKCVAICLALVSAAAFAQTDTRKNYIVQLADPPVATYAGTIPGLPATRPAPGQKLDIDASTVNAYIRYLETRRDNVLASIPPADVVYRYQYVFNGFAASMAPDTARKLRSNAGVVAVTEDEARPLHTTRTPGFLGLNTPGGLWSRTDTAFHNVKGEDVIIGILDSGVWPEDPSFSDKLDPVTGKPIPYHQAGTLAYGPPPAKWKGICQTGPGFTAAMCQNKLIGARFFDATFLSVFHSHQPTDYASPRDSDGHGSHTMSTAGGNENVDAVISGVSYGLMSGVAPRARIAVYKVCWQKPTPNTTCFSSDSVAAIDRAVADGVDVLNYSISGTKTNYLDPVEVAFFNAVAAGVFVAASAGNDGPANELNHPSPWLATVGASTHDRFKTANVVLGNAQQFNGASTQASGLASTPLIHAENAGVVAYASLNATDQAALRLCYNATNRASFGGSASAALDPVKVAGKIVVCIRGNSALVDKAGSVKAAGGIGMVLQNEPASVQTLVQQAYVIPTVHLATSTSEAVQTYARQAGATASFTGGVQQAGVIAPVMADFSSRGPSLANGNVLKPDIAAPGVDVIAAYVPENAFDPAVRDAIIAGTANGQPNATSLQGTSMASPHVAGTAALLRQLHPQWTPAAIRSAMTTSASPVKLASGAADPARFGYGSGHLNPNGAADPVLVYDADASDYVRFLCGIGTLSQTGSTCISAGSILPWNLNLPSLTASDVVGKITFRRTVRNVSGTGKTFTPTANVPGWAATVSPATLTLPAGGAGPFDLTLTRTTAPDNTYVFGDLVWSDGVTQVKSPVTVRAGIKLTVPSQIEDTRAAGTKVFTVGTGYEGILAATPIGLTPATRLSGSVGTGQTQCFDVAVPAGAAHLRVALFNSDTAGGASTDLDLTLSTAGVAALSSENGDSNEQLNVSNPKAGTWSACVKGFVVPTGGGAFTLSAWVVGPAVGTQTLRVALPSKIYLGGTASVAAAWSVPAGKRYLGIIQFRDGNGTALGSTLVSITP